MEDVNEDGADATPAADYSLGPSQNFTRGTRSLTLIVGFDPHALDGLLSNAHTMSREVMNNLL
jgi:hypothetical protein